MRAVKLAHFVLIVTLLEAIIGIAGRAGWLRSRPPRPSCGSLATVRDAALLSGQLGMRGAPEDNSPARQRG